MENEVRIFDKAAEFAEWIDNNDLTLVLNEKEAELLFNYMEGHGYAIGIKDDRMVRVDINEENGEIDEYTIDEVIDTVCEWNYELIQEADTARKNPKNFADFCEQQSRYEQLKEDERMLDVMFDRTCYGKRLNEVAQKLVQKALEGIGEKRAPDEAKNIICAGISDYEEERVR